MEQIFKHGDIIEWLDEGYYECICADNINAVFAPCIDPRKESNCIMHTEFRSMFVVDNTDIKSIMGKYQTIKKAS